MAQSIDNIVTNGITSFIMYKFEDPIINKTVN
jgi:hypothetical protein